MLGSNLKFRLNFKSIFCKQTVQNKIRHHVLCCLIWFYTVCLCPQKGGKKGFEVLIQWHCLRAISILLNNCTVRKRFNFVMREIQCIYSRFLALKNRLKLIQKCRINLCILRLKAFLTFTNTVDPDEIMHNVAFHLGLHCLQKYPFIGFPYTKGSGI